MRRGQDTESGGAAYGDRAAFDHGSDPNFFAYYERESLSETAIARFRGTMQKLVALGAREGLRGGPLDVVDIGCGAGTQSRLWAEQGHRVYGIDVNQPLIELARERSAAARLTIKFDVGSATRLPYETESMDICLMPELLEHVVDWRSCLDEAVRVLRPGGLLFLSTTNVLCPKQQEFNLPLYSWYPGVLKRRVEKLAVTTRPQWANYAKYPAVHWFSYYGLAAYLEARGMESFDRFTMMDPNSLSGPKRIAAAGLRAFAPLRLLGHIMTEGTVVFAAKRRRTQ